MRRSLVRCLEVPVGWQFNREVFASLKGKDFLDMLDYSPAQLKSLLDGAHTLKRTLTPARSENEFADSYTLADAL